MMYDVNQPRSVLLADAARLVRCLFEPREIVSVSGAPISHSVPVAIEYRTVTVIPARRIYARRSQSGRCNSRSSGNRDDSPYSTVAVATRLVCCFIGCEGRVPETATSDELEIRHMYRTPRCD